MESSQCLFRGLVRQPSGFGPIRRQSFWTWSLCGSLSSLGLLSQVLPGCDTTNCAVPGKASHNNTIRTLERSLLAADTDGYANAKSGTVRDCAGKSSGKGYRDTSTSHSQSLSSRSLGGLDGAAALPAAAACGEQSYGSREEHTWSAFRLEVLTAP